MRREDGRRGDGRVARCLTRLSVPLALMLFLALAGCDDRQEVSIATAVPTRPLPTREAVQTIAPTPQSSPEPPGSHLTVCLDDEPASLFDQGHNNPSTEAVLGGIFEPDFIALSYQMQAQGLEKVPTIDDGDAAIRTVTVSEGDRVVDAAGKVVELVPGVRVITADREETIFDGSSLEMEQLVVDYVMKQRFWSDGRPVTAADSVFGFEIAGDLQDGLEPAEIERTERYQATGSLRTRWIGLPGSRDPVYASNFWQPRPRHLWEDIPRAQLPFTEAAARLPQGDGPFRIVDWQEGKLIRLEPNPYYYRAPEGFPRLDSVTFVFVPDAHERIAMLLSGACHVMSGDGLDLDLLPFFEEARQASVLNLYMRRGPELVELSFGVNSWGDFGDGLGRPDWFEDQRVRQAVAMCIDRQSITDRLLLGQTAVAQSYLPVTHPQYARDLAEWPYDPQTARLLLDEAGFANIENDGIRRDPVTRRPLDVSLLVDPGRHEQMLGNLIADDLLQCGIKVAIVAIPAAERLAQNEGGPVFGRRFDLAITSTPAAIIPDCGRFTLQQVTGAEEETNPLSGEQYVGWNGRNFSGWSDPAFDEVCTAAQNGLLGSPEFTQDHQEAQRLYARFLPALPLYFKPDFVAARPSVLHIANDPSARTELWNLFAIELAE